MPDLRDGPAGVMLGGPDLWAVRRELQKIAGGLLLAAALAGALCALA